MIRLTKLVIALSFIAFTPVLSPAAEAEGLGLDIEVNHNGVYIMIPLEALPAHLAHGDSVGSTVPPGGI